MIIWRFHYDEFKFWFAKYMGSPRASISLSKNPSKAEITVASWFSGHPIKSIAKVST